MSDRRQLGSALFSGTVPQSVVADAAFTLLRVFAGLSMALGHGMTKIKGPKPALVETISDLGLPAPQAVAWLVAITEFFGGITLAAGLLTRLSAAAICITMLVAAFAVHGYLRGDGYRDMEPALLYAAIAYVFLLTGSGRFSIDKMLR